MTSRPLEIAPVVPAGQEKVTVAGANHALAFQRRHPASPPTSPPNGRLIADSISDQGLDGIGATSIQSQNTATGEKLAQWNEDLETGSQAEPVVSTLHARFHLDLASAVAAAVGDEYW